MVHWITQSHRDTVCLYIVWFRLSNCLFFSKRSPMKDSLHLSQYKKNLAWIICKTLWDTLALNDRLTMRAARKYHHLYSRIYHNVSSAVVAFWYVLVDRRREFRVCVCMCVRRMVSCMRINSRIYTVGAKCAIFRWRLCEILQRNSKEQQQQLQHMTAQRVNVYEYMFICAFLIFARSANDDDDGDADETTQYRWSRGP